MARAQHGADAPAAAEDDAGHPRPAATALFSCCPADTVLTAGAALARLSGRPLAEVSGVPAYELLHPSSHARLQHAQGLARREPAPAPRAVGSRLPAAFSLPGPVLTGQALARIIPGLFGAAPPQRSLVCPDLSSESLARPAP